MTKSAFLVASPIRQSLVRDFLESGRGLAQKAMGKVDVHLPDTPFSALEIIPKFYLEVEFAGFIQMAVDMAGDIHDQLDNGGRPRITTIAHYSDTSGDDVLYGMVVCAERFRAVAQALYTNFPTCVEWAIPKRNDGYMPNLPICRGKGISVLVQGDSLSQSLMQRPILIDEEIARPIMYTQASPGTWIPFTETPAWKSWRKNEPVRKKHEHIGRVVRQKDTA